MSELEVNLSRKFGVTEGQVDRSDETSYTQSCMTRECTHESTASTPQGRSRTATATLCWGTPLAAPPTFFIARALRRALSLVLFEEHLSERNRHCMRILTPEELSSR